MNNIDIILTSYNRPKMIRKAIDSVLLQKGVGFNLWIMDDNSNRETIEVLKEYFEKDTRIHVVKFSTTDEDRTKTVRYASIINEAIKRSNGEYITYLTDDCYYLPGRLKVMSEYLDSHKDIYAVYGNQLLINTPLDVLIAYKVSNDKVQYAKGLSLRGNYGPVRNPNNVLDHNQVMHRRSVIDKIGIWDTDINNSSLCKDGEFFQRIADNFGPFMPVNINTDVFKFHGKSLSDSIRNQEDLSGIRE